MVEFANVLIDPKKLTDGKWVRWIDGVELKIASMRNRQYMAHRKALLAPALRDVRADKIEPDALLVLLAPAIATHLLKDWKGIEQDGEPLPYSIEKATELLAHPAAPHLREFVINHAGDDGGYYANREDSLGN